MATQAILGTPAAKIVKRDDQPQQTASKVQADPTEKNDVGKGGEQPAPAPRLSDMLFHAATPEDEGPEVPGGPAGPETTEAEAAENEAKAKAARAAYEKSYRTSNDIGIEILGSDVPGLTCMYLNSPAAPTAIKPLLGVFNLVNGATGFFGMANDMRESYDTQRNPKATAMDKFVDWAHVGLGTVSTAGDFIPVFDTAMNQHPVTAALFYGSQVLGLVLDTAKTIYDTKRGGTQSHIDGSDEKAAATDAILDNVEKTAGKVMTATGTVGVEAMAMGWTLGLPAEAASEVVGTLATFGGSVGLIMGVTQVQKAMDLRAKLHEAQENGQTTIKFPVVTKDGPQMKEMAITDALKRVDSMQAWGRAQEASGALTAAAGITGAHLLAMGALAGGIGLAVVAAGTIVYHFLPQSAKDKVDKVLAPIGHAAHVVGEWASPVTAPIDKALGYGVTELQKGMSWAGKKMGEETTKFIKWGQPVWDFCAPASNYVLHKGYQGAEATLHGLQSTAHAVTTASNAIGEFTTEHLPVVAHAWHEAGEGLGHAWDLGQKALGNYVETVPEKPAATEGNIAA